MPKPMGVGSPKAMSATKRNVTHTIVINRAGMSEMRKGLRLCAR